MIDQKKSKYIMKFTLVHNMEKAEWLQKVIDCLGVSQDYLPQKVSMDGCPYTDFEEAVLFKYIKEKNPLSVRLKRDKKLKYELIVETKGFYCKILKLEWKESKNEKKWKEYVSLCEILIDAFQPDFAYISRRYIVIPPYTNRTEEILDMMNYSFFIDSKYDEYGPGGLGLLTYLSKDFTKRLGAKRIQKAPISKNEVFMREYSPFHEKTDWKAVVFTLVDNPYEATEDVVATAWELAMDYFSETNFFAIYMPSIKNPRGGINGLMKRKSFSEFHPKSPKREFHFWNRSQFCYEALDYFDQGDYEKSVELFTKEIESCTPENPYFKKIAISYRVKALKMLERWEDEIKDLTELIKGFEPAFKMVSGWCKNCNDACALDYSKEEYALIDLCNKAGYWPYEVSNKGYVYVNRKWHLEPENVKNTDFEELPDSWCCPYCGAKKHTFITQKVQMVEAFEQAEICQRRGELYQEHGMEKLAKADFDMAYSLNAKLL